MHFFETIHWMEDGEIVESGDLKQLLEKGKDGVLSTIFKKTDRRMYNWMLNEVGLADLN